MGRIVLILGIIGLLFCGYILREEYRANQVYNKCWSEHFETDGEGEQACGDLQVKYKYEFLCNANGSACWVEKNTDLQ